MRNYSVRLVEKPDQTGVVIGEHMLVVPDQSQPSGFRITSILSVLWDDVRTPSPDHCVPEQLEWIDILNESDFDSDEDEEDEEDEESLDYSNPAEREAAEAELANATEVDSEVVADANEVEAEDAPEGSMS